jgi:hypothetical protein
MGEADGCHDVCVPHAYPTLAHERAADAIVDWFADQPETEAVLLTNSCARGKATPDSCLDVQVLVPPARRDDIAARWTVFADTSPAIRDLAQVGRWSELHLDVGDGVFTPGEIAHEGVDYLEIQVGNLLAYSVPLFTRGDRLERLRAEWLPFYGDELRAERLAAARYWASSYLDRIPWYVGRELHFQAFDRLYRALGYFLLGLHVSRRTYPLSYDKWIREQVAENLGLPELYEQLPRLFELRRFESDEVVGKAEDLRALVDVYLVQ